MANSMRIVTKVGFLYKTIDTKKGARYLQLVSLDLINLNSDVIVVFAKDVDPRQLEEISPKDIEFYTHTTVSEGVRQGLWEKVGNFEVKVDITKLAFKNYHDSFTGRTLSSSLEGPSLMPKIPFPNWTTWNPLDEEWKYISLEVGRKLVAEDGGIKPPSDIVYRIENGKSEFAGYEDLTQTPLAGWKRALREVINETVSEKTQALIYKKDSGFDQWTLVKDNKRYIFAVQYGKYNVIREFRIVFAEVAADDEYGITSPAAELKYFYPEWKDAKRITLASSDTEKIREKTKYVYWKFSGEKEWIYCYNKEQLDIIGDTIIPNAVNKFLSKVPQ